MTDQTDSKNDEKVITTTCSYDCGARCLLMELGKVAASFPAARLRNPKIHMTEIYDALL